jgi:hypothetical protein
MRLRPEDKLPRAPTFVLAKSGKDKLDGVRLVGAQPYAAFQSAIDRFLTN